LFAGVLICGNHLPTRVYVNYSLILKEKALFPIHNIRKSSPG
jgi:hypothetical protein